MQWYGILILCFGLFALFAIPGVWVSIALGISGIIAMAVLQESASQVIANCVWKLCTDFTLTAIPMFLFMGQIIIESGLSTRFYKGVSKYLRHIPGGLLHANIVACGIFSAISGSSPATAAAIGGVAMPEMNALNYKKKYTQGSIAAGGTLGILIPPSIALIVYGSLVSESVTKLFTAAIIPGIIMVLIYIAYIIIIALRNKEDFKDINWDYYQTVSTKEAMIGILPMVLMIGIVLGSIYTGVATPTEAAALGCILAIVIGKAFGSLTLKKLWLSAGKSVRNSTMILFIILGANIFSYVMSSTKATASLVQFLTSLNINRTAFLLMVYALYIFLGCFLEGTSMQYLTLPVLFPVLKAYGFNPIWFGIVLVVLIEVGLLTPPMGLNLYIVKGLDKESSIGDVVKGSVPYIFLMLLMVAILTVFPQIVTFTVS